MRKIMVTDTFKTSKPICHKSQQNNQITNIQSITYSNDKMTYKESLLYKKAN